MPRVAVVFTGGTISMRHDPAAGGNVPVLAGADLLAATPGLGLDGTLEPADDVTKTHSRAFDTFRSLNVGPIGRVDGERVRLERSRGRRRHVVTTRAAERVFLVTATVATDGTPINALRAA